MDKKVLIPIGIIILFVGIIIGRFTFKIPNGKLGGTGISGYTGVYNSTALTLYDKQSSAAALDQNGRIMFSPSSTINLQGE